MKTLRLSLHLAAVALFALIFTSVASAQATRTWVSGVGDDANPCSRTAPCKTFAGAISKTAAGGIIDCLDPGGFGAVTITKSIQIDCDAGPGGTLVAGVNAIVINGAGINVELRSLNLDGLGQPGSTQTPGVNGVSILTAANVHLVDMNIEGFAQNGVNVNVGSNAGSNLTLSIQNVNIHECASGIVTNGNVAVIGDFDRVSIWNVSGSGINAQNGSRLTVHNSTIFGTAVGVNQTSVGGNGSQVTVFQSIFGINGVGLQSIGMASIGTSTSVYSLNGTVFNINGGTITSTGDNVLNGNSANGALGGPAPAITKM